MNVKIRASLKSIPGGDWSAHEEDSMTICDHEEGFRRMMDLIGERAEHRSLCRLSIFLDIFLTTYF